MKMSPIGSPGTNSPQAPIRPRRAHPFGVAHRQLGGDPAADAVADQIEALQPQRVEDFEIMEDDIVDAVAFGELVAPAQPGWAGAITRAASPSRW